VAKNKTMPADYIVHFIGYAAFVIGKDDRNEDAICGLVHAIEASVNIIYKDREEMSEVLGLVAKQAQSIPRQRYMDYLAQLPSEGPIPVEVHGLGIYWQGGLKFCPLQQAFDARKFAQTPRRASSSGRERGDMPAGPGRFAVQRSMVQDKARTPWTPQFALGARCLQIDRSRILRHRQLQLRVPDPNDLWVNDKMNRHIK